MERVFKTLQSRLPPELRLAEIATIEAANRYLEERFIPDYNARFAVAAAEPGSAFIPYAGRPLEDVLCIQEDRQVGRDNCVQWRRLSLQIRRSATVTITSRRPCACTNIPTVASPSSTARAALPGSTALENRSMSRGPLNSARRAQPVDMWTCAAEARKGVQQ